MKSLRIFLLAALILVVFGAEDVEAEHTFGQLPIQEFSQSGRGQSVDISEDGKYVVAGTNNEITLYDRELESQIWSYGSDTRAVSISPNGEYIAGVNDDEIYLFGNENSYPLWTYEFPYDYGSDSILALEFTDNGEKLILSSSYNISLFDVSNGDLVWYHSDGFFFTAGIYDYDVSADGQYVAVCSSSGDTIVYDSRFVGNDNYSFSYNSNWVEDCNSIAISPSGDHIVTVSTDSPISEDSVVVDVAYLNFYESNNNNTIKTIELDKEIYQQDESQPFCIKQNMFSSPNPTCYESDLAFSEDGNHIALAFNKRYGEWGYDENWPNMSASLYLFDKEIVEESYVEVWNYTIEDSVYYNCGYLPRIDLSADGQDIVYSCGSRFEWGTLFFFDDIVPDILKPPKWSAGYEIFDQDMSIFGDIKPIGRWNSVSMSADGEFVAAIRSSYSGKVAIYNNSLPKPDLEIGCCSDNLEISNEEPLGGDSIILSVEIWMFDCCHRAIDSHFIVSFYYSDYNYPENLYLIGNVTVDKGFMEPSSSEYNVSVTWTNIPVGNFNLYVIADSTNLIDERDEDNNFIASEWGSEYPEFIGYDGLAIWERPIAIAGNDVTVDRGETVQFAGMGSADDRLNIVKYQWDFDADGLYEYESSKDGITTFIYNEEGKHTAIFKITDDGGFEATDSRIITVKATDYQEKEKCTDGDTKIAEDGCNQCICNNEEWVCTEVDCNPDDKDDDKDDDESSLPSVSMIPALISIGLIARYRRK